MPDNEERRNLNRFQSLISRHTRNARSVNVVDLLQKIYGTFIDNKTSVLRLCVNDSLQPCTDGKTIIVSLIPDFLKDKYSDEDWFIVLKAALAHESQHVNSSNFKDIEKIRDWYGNLLAKEAGVSKNVGAEIGKNVLNIVEDGRIEAIAVQRRPGMFLPFMYLNQVIREGTAIEEVADNEAGEFCDFINNILSYAKTGLYSPGIKVYAGTRLEENFLKIEKMIDEGVNARTSNECCTVVMELLKTATPYIKELIQNDELQSIMEQPSVNEYSSNNESQYGDGKASALRSDSPRNDKENKQTGNDQSECKDQNQTTNNDEKNNQSKNGDGDQKDKDQSPSSNNKSESAEKNDEKMDGNSQSGDSDKDQNGSESINQDQAQNESKTADNSESKDEGGCDHTGQKSETEKELSKENKQSKSFSDAKDTTPLSMERLDEIRKEMARQLKAPPQPKPSSSSVLDRKSLNKVASVFNKTGDDLIELKAKIHITSDLPPEMKVQARQLRREIQKIVDARKNASRNLRRGTLNTADLWKTGLREDTIFEKRSNIDKSSIAFYLLIDNSGSTRHSCGGTLKKFEAARSTAAVIEEASKSLLPCKIALFNDNGNVIHTVIKDFDDKEKGNFSWNSIRTIRPTGCNADSVNIRIAAEELSRRREARKVLFVLSDGLPSAYNSEEDASREVRQAVKDARNKGIVVIPIMFGDDKSRKQLINQYLEMYEKDLISCRPQEIMNTLVRTFRLVLAR